MSYQDERGWARRYELVKERLDWYDRPFSVFDLGANAGNFGLSIANDFADARVVMADKRDCLVRACEQRRPQRVLALQRKLKPADLEALARSECFDVVLALSVLHHFNDWYSAMLAVVALGTRIIVEIPPAADVNACGRNSRDGLLRMVKELRFEHIGSAESHVTPGVHRPIFMLDRKKERVQAQCIGADVLGARRVRPHRIYSGPLTKRISFKGAEHRDWVEGMNLWNFANLGGSWPSAERVVELMHEAYDREPDHPDLRPWNMVFDGDRVHFIDRFHHARRSGPVALDLAVQMVKRSLHCA